VQKVKDCENKQPTLAELVVFADLIPDFVVSSGLRASALLLGKELAGWMFKQLQCSEGDAHVVLLELMVKKKNVKKTFSYNRIYIFFFSSLRMFFMFREEELAVDQKAL
jgi:hypothetical protein